MPLNTSLPDYYVDGLCNLVGKAADGSYDLGTMQHLSESECNLALNDWEKFVKEYGDKYGIKQDGSGGDGSHDPGAGLNGKKGNSFFDFGSKGLFNWIGLGLLGGNNDDGGASFNIKDALLIAGIIILLFLFLKRKK